MPSTHTNAPENAQPPSGAARASLTKNMDVFSLRDSVVREYEKFATSFTTIWAEDIRQQVRAIYASDRYWPEPLIQINPSYKRSTSVTALVDGGMLDPRCADIFRSQGEPLSLYDHQKQAIALASQGESYVVTTGTGSGKSLCFFIPIASAILADKRRDPTPRTRAIVIYPMNALANSQLEELEKYVGNVEGERPLTFERYTGQESKEERQRVADHPPDILLTNFMMLELLMTRQDELDRKVIGNCAGLRFLVLDELHTYRGRQGADVALLVRRVRERLAPDRLQCIGTSATMASEGSRDEKNAVVARVASKLFSIAIPESNVIVETLERVTDPLEDKKLPTTLGPAIDAGIPHDIRDAALRVHPLAVWVERTLGVTFSDVEHRWERARPHTVTEAVEKLSEDSGRDAATCRSALRDLLLVSSAPERDRTGDREASERSFFAFKLHQFISGAGHAFATLEPPGKRSITVEGQQFLPGSPEKRLYPLHFCRKCGQEYHPVRLVVDGLERKLLARDIDDGPIVSPEDEEAAEEPTPDAEGELLGFATLHSTDAEDFALLNPNTHTCPTFRTRRDADINLAIYRRAGVLWRERDPAANPWRLRFMQGLFNMASDSGLFRTQTDLEQVGAIRADNQYTSPQDTYLPLVEAKMVHHFDHRFGTYDEQTESQANQGKLPELDVVAHADADRLTLPRYWVAATEVRERLRDRWDRGWLLGWRDICRSTDQRTVIASLIPVAGTGDTFLLAMPAVDPRLVPSLYANLCSFALDYTARQKVGGTHLKYNVFKQLPVLQPTAYERDTEWAPGTLLRDWILPRVLELTYTAWDLEPFARDVGSQGPPFRWDPERRFLMRAELDAAFFHLYGISRDDADYILDTFPIVRKNDEKAHGEYRTKRVILEIYDELAHATQTGIPYQTRLDPPPADPRVAHPPRK